MRSYRFRSGRLLASLSLAVLPLVACSGVSQQDPDDVFVVDEGKADNFYSTVAKEYYVDGESQVVLDEGDRDKPEADKLERAKQLMGLKNIQIGWFLHVRLVDKSRGSGEHGDPNAETYPGFHAMVRNGGYLESELAAAADGMTYRFKVRLQVAGQKRLIEELPGEMLDATHKKLTLQMGKVSNADLARLEAEHEWFRDSKWDSGSFDPAKMSPEELEAIDLVIYPQPESTDGYVDVNRVFEDGKLTIDVHFGWDYWDRYDVRNARDLYDALRDNGFESPVEGFEKYEASKGRLTRTVDANGKEVTVEVRIYHGSQPDVAPGPDPDTDAGGEQMEKDMYASLAESDVIVFGGHSGNYYGFALANWRKTSRGALNYPQLRAAKMPADRYQIVLASGCDTFSIGQAFRENESKPGLANLDVITTTTFSNAGSNDELWALFDALFGFQRYGSASERFSPKTYQQLLEGMNGSWGLGAMYGVHGIDDNPRLHPFANLAKLGKSCTATSQCGNPDGNRCTKISSQRRVCSATCLDDSGCPEGYGCKQVASGNTLAGRQCLR